MATKKFRQFTYEHESWKRWLAYIRDEQIYAREQLMEVLAGEIDKSNLEQAEYFQNSFTAGDELVSWLRKEIATQDKLLDKEVVLTGMIINNHENLREDVIKARQFFDSLSGKFYGYLSENFSFSA
jgi:hypothetical protein